MGEGREAYRTRRHLGLAEIQTKVFECVLQDYYAGGEIPGYAGHYFIPEDFRCNGCSSAEETAHVKVWIEIEDRCIKAVLAHNPVNGKPDQITYPRPL